VDGAVVRHNKTLDDKNTDFQDRIDRLDKQLEAKRLRLELQFSNMETVLAKLQNQQTSLASLSNITYSSNR
jgi:flagellar capping protein FliD